MVESLSGSEVPVVLVNRTIDESGLSVVAGDDHQGIGLSVKHLVGLGHRRIAFVGAAMSASTGFNRYQHFLAWMQSLGLEVDQDLLVFAPWFTKDDGADATEELLARGADFTAIVAANDLIALGCYRALRATGRDGAGGRLGGRLQRLAVVRRVQPAAHQHPRAEVRDRPTGGPARPGAARHPGSPPSSVLLPTTLQVRGLDRAASRPGLSRSLTAAGHRLYSHAKRLAREGLTWPTIRRGGLRRR